MMMQAARSYFLSRNYSPWWFFSSRLRPFDFDGQKSQTSQRVFWKSGLSKAQTPTPDTSSKGELRKEIPPVSYEAQADRCWFRLFPPAIRNELFIPKTFPSLVFLARFKIATLGCGPEAMTIVCIAWIARKLERGTWTGPEGFVVSLWGQFASLKLTLRPWKELSNHPCSAKMFVLGRVVCSKNTCGFH